VLPPGNFAHILNRTGPIHSSLNQRRGEKKGKRKSPITFTAVTKLGPNQTPTIAFSRTENWDKEEEKLKREEKKKGRYAKSWSCGRRASPAKDGFGVVRLVLDEGEARLWGGLGGRTVLWEEGQVMVQGEEERRSMHLNSPISFQPEIIEMPLSSTVLMHGKYFLRRGDKV